MLKSMRKSISCYFYHIFVSPGVAPGAIALSVAWIKKNSMLTNCLAACAYLTITVSAIEREIMVKKWDFSYRLAFDAPVRGVPVGISTPRFMWKNYNGVATRG